MKLWVIIALVLTVAVTVIVSAPEDRFFGEGYDGYMVAGSVPVPTADDCFKGGSCDGYEKTSFGAVTNFPAPPARGTVIIIR